MKSIFFLFVFFLTFYGTGHSQLGPGQTGAANTNNIPSFCQCLSFVESCSGKLIPSLPGTKVSIICSDYPTKEYEIVDGQVCFENKCESGSVCINGGNWEVCKVVGCTVYLSQSLPTAMTVNGTPLGYGPLSPGNTSSLVRCGRRVHTGALNNEAGATDILVCPGDPVELNISGMSLLRGMCLTITIRNLNNAVVASQTFTAPSNPLSITNLIGNLGIGTYKMEMRIHCCNGPTECSFNAYKFAYINIQGQFAYDAYYTSGFFTATPLAVPASSPPSSIINGTPFNGINLLNFFANNVQNSSNTAVNLTFNQINCTTHGNPQPLYSTSTPATGNFNISFPIFQSNTCQCFRLDLTYDDGCGNGLTTDSYYFKEGKNCPPDAIQDGGGTQSRNANTIDLKGKCKVSPNPMTHFMNIAMEDEWIGQDIEINIYDAQGRALKSIQSIGQPLLQIDIDLSNGMYYYVIKGLDTEVKGKFVKM